MSYNSNLDVPSPINLKDQIEAEKWAEETNIKRPWRYAFFQCYSQIIQDNRAIQILEIGAGPGFLAEYLLSQHAEIQYTAVDFSEAMHHLSQNRLDETSRQRIHYIVADFKQAEWHKSLDENSYDMIIIHQALHELRHKQYAVDFHKTIKKLLKENAEYLVCDHLYAENAMKNNQLYMSKEEHIKAFEQAGFLKSQIILDFKGLCLFKCM